MTDETSPTQASSEGAFSPAFRADWEKLVSSQSLVQQPAGGVTLSALETERRATLPDGIRPTAAWRVWQVVDDPRMEVARALIAEDLAGGGEAVWLRGGLEHGTRMLTTGDLDLVLKDVDLASTPVQLESEADALPLGAALLAIADERGVPRASLRGGLGADALGTLARSGTLPSGLRGALRDGQELALLCRPLPELRSGLVCTWAHHDAGADAVQEVGWALSTGLEYLRNLEDAGLSTSEAARELRFSVGVSSEIFTEVAKLRALRWAWAKLVRACGGDADACVLSLHARSSNASRTRRDPWVNMLRGSAETFAAAVGGADAISTASYDRALLSEDPEARRVARGTQRVMRDEAQLARVDDVAGGSFYIENLSHEIARAAWEELQAVEEMGGMVRAVRRGRVARALDLRQEELTRQGRLRTRAVVGVSHFANVSEEVVQRPKVDLQDVEVELGNPFGTAGPDARHDALIRFAEAIRDGAGEFPPSGTVGTRAVEAMVLGIDTYSVADVLRVGQAELHAAPLRACRIGGVWETLRDAMDQHIARGNERPRVFHCTVGAGNRSVGSWARGLFAAAGFAVATNADTFASEDEALAEVARSGARIAVIAGGDDLTERTARLGPMIKERGIGLVATAALSGDEVLAGADFVFSAERDPIADMVRVFRMHGVDRGLP